MHNHIKILRTEKGWSQAKLAELLGVSRQSVNAVETGKFDPSLPLAFAISRLFKKPIESIFIDMYHETTKAIKGETNDQGN